MSLSHEHTDNFFICQSSILDAHLRLLFRAFHYGTPCRGTSILLHSTKHSMATANLKKSEEFVTNTTAASKYIPRRPRISINWNPTFQTSLHKISKEIFFRLTKFFFRNKNFFSKEQLLFSFLCIVRQKKILEWSEKFWKFLIFKNH